MRATRPGQEEIAGLALAVLAHVGLLAWLVAHPLGPKPVAPPERMTVTLSDDLAAHESAPQAAPAQAAEAPELAPEPAPAPGPAPQPLPRVIPTPQPAPAPAPPPKAAPAPAPKPLPKAPAPPAKTPPAKPAPAPATKGGASRIGADFLKGVNTPVAAKGAAPAPAAATISAETRASFAQAVLRQVRPNWQGRVPQGVGTEKIVSVLSISLDPDGTLAGEPRLLRQEGVDDDNRAQAARHAEEAIRAVKASAPFNLPRESYEAWKTLPPLRFRKGS